MKFAFTLSAATVLALSIGTAFAGTNEAGALRPDGKGGGIATNAGEAVANPNVTPIVFHGGPVLNNKKGVNVYYIWYGNWAGDTATTILTDFMNTLGGSPYFNINTTYTGSNNKAIKNKIKLVQSINDNYSQGTALTDAKVQAVVSSAISAGTLPKDANALYFVLTSKDVNETGGFCTQYCGWHSNANISGTNIKYSFVGNAARCLSACAIQSNGPNGNGGADGMASVIAHELEETVTDPDGNAWYFASGAENADECAWTFGTEYNAANGTKANMKLGSRDFLIQQNWINNGQSSKCAVSF